MQTENPKIYLGLQSSNTHLNHTVNSMEDLIKRNTDQDDGHIKKTSWSPCNCNSQVFFRPSKIQFTLESLKFQLLSWVYRDRLGRWHQEASPVYLQVQKLG
jgi:hypothetical protein